MQYTSPDLIYRRIKSRLDLDVSSFGSTPSSMFPGVATSATKIPIDSLLVEDIVNEIEEWLNCILEQLYETPLQSTEHYILKNIVTNLSVAELLRNYFQGIGLATLSSDVSSYSTKIINDAYYNVHCLTAGSNLPIPSVAGLPIPPSEDFFKRTPGAILLKGEFPLSSRRKRKLISETNTYVGNKLDATGKDVNARYGICWNIGDNVGPGGRIR